MKRLNYLIICKQKYKIYRKKYHFYYFKLYNKQTAKKYVK
jgi:hypothetical protein